MCIDKLSYILQPNQKKKKKKTSKVKEIKECVGTRDRGRRRKATKTNHGYSTKYCLYFDSQTVIRNIHNITTTPSLYCNLTFDFIDILLILHL